MSGVTPWRMSPGVVRPPSPPPSDATVAGEWRHRPTGCTKMDVLRQGFRSFERHSIGVTGQQDWVCGWERQPSATIRSEK